MPESTYQTAEQRDRRRKGNLVDVRIPAQQVISQQQLGERELITVAGSRTILVLAELYSLEWPQIRQVLPDRVFQLLGMGGGNPSIDAEKVGRRPSSRPSSRRIAGFASGSPSIDGGNALVYC